MLSRKKPRTERRSPATVAVSGSAVEDIQLARISPGPDVCCGKPGILGHRIWVSRIRDLLAAGTSIAEVLENYPGRTEEDILVCIAHGAKRSRERYVEIPAAVSEEGLCPGEI